MGLHLPFILSIAVIVSMFGRGETRGRRQGGEDAAISQGPFKRIRSRKRELDLHRRPPLATRAANLPDAPCSPAASRGTGKRPTGHSTPMRIRIGKVKMLRGLLKGRRPRQAEGQRLADSGRERAGRPGPEVAALTSKRSIWRPKRGRTPESQVVEGGGGGGD